MSRGDFIIIIMEFTMSGEISVMEKKGEEMARKGTCSIFKRGGWERLREKVQVQQVGNDVRTGEESS